MRAIDADALMADCQLAQKQASRHGREFANAFYSGGGEISTEWWCVEDMIENAPTIEPERKPGKWKVQTDEDRSFIWWKCSECGHIIFSESERDRRDFHAFCGRCGADMRERREE